jgi:hypothetical protein
MAGNSVNSVGSALLPLISAQQQRALTFPQETKDLPQQARSGKDGVSSTLSEDQRNQLSGRAATLSQDDDMAGLPTRVRQAVQAYQTQAVDAEREQISRLMGVDEFA